MRLVSSLFQQKFDDNYIFLSHHALQVMHVLGFDPHAFAHFRDERKRRRSQVIYTGYLPCLQMFSDHLIFCKIAIYYVLMQNKVISFQSHLRFLKRHGWNLSPLFLSLSCSHISFSSLMFIWFNGVICQYRSVFCSITNLSSCTRELSTKNGNEWEIMSKNEHTRRTFDRK